MVGWIVDVLVGWIVGSIVGGLVFGVVGAAVGAEGALTPIGVVGGTVAGIVLMRRRRVGAT
jgi:membrane protease YdiL (CAAX protease family)